jgi:hypothetical protein
MVKEEALYSPVKSKSDQLGWKGASTGKSFPDMAPSRASPHHLVELAVRQWSLLIA